MGPMSQPRGYHRSHVTHAGSYLHTTMWAFCSQLYLFPHIEGAVSHMACSFFSSKFQKKISTAKTSSILSRYIWKMSVAGYVWLRRPGGTPYGFDRVPVEAYEGDRGGLLPAQRGAGVYQRHLLVRAGSAASPTVPAVRHARLAAGVGNRDGQAQGPHDVCRHDHGQLPASRLLPQFLPQHHLQPGRQRVGRRLYARGDGETRQRPLNSTQKNPENNNNNQIQCFFPSMRRVS